MRVAAGSCRALSSAFALLVFGLAAAAQQTPTVDVEVDEGPHYAGEAISIRVIARGFDEDPAPQASVPPPASGRLELAGMSPSVNQSITIINGRMTRTREVTHVFQFRYIASGAGTERVGPFRVSQGKTVAGAPAIQLSANSVPTTDDVAVRLKLPEGPVFVGERVPVTIEFELAKSLGENLLSYELRVPLFDRNDVFRFLDPGSPRRR